MNRAITPPETTQLFDPNYHNPKRSEKEEKAEEAQGLEPNLKDHLEEEMGNGVDEERRQALDHNQEKLHQPPSNNAVVNARDSPAGRSDAVDSGEAGGPGSVPATITGGDDEDEDAGKSRRDGGRAASTSGSISMDHGGGETAAAASGLGPSEGGASNADKDKTLLLRGTRVNVKFENPPEWFSGHVASYDAGTGKYLVEYDDGDTAEEDLSHDESWAVVAEPLLRGRRLEVFFENPEPGAWFGGVVLEHKRGGRWYSLVYDDGDTEVADLRSGETVWRLVAECQEVNAGSKAKKKKKKKRKAEGPAREEKPEPEEAGEIPMGTRLEVLFDDPPEYFAGVVASSRPKKGLPKGSRWYLIKYDDGTEEDVDLISSKTTFRLLETPNKKMKTKRKTTVKEKKKEKRAPKPTQSGRIEAPGVGDRVEVWYDDPPGWFPSTVLERKGTRIMVQYDSDGVTEYLDLTDPEAKVRPLRVEAAEAEQPREEAPAEVRPEDVVWVKTNGFPWWPCVKMEDGDCEVGNGKVLCVFYGKEQREHQFVEKAKVVPFLERFQDLLPLEDPNPKLHKSKKPKKVSTAIRKERARAVREACYSLGLAYDEEKGATRKLRKGEKVDGISSWMTRAGKKAKKVKKERKQKRAEGEGETARDKARREEEERLMAERVAKGLRVPKKKVIRDIGYDAAPSAKGKVKKEQKADPSTPPAAKRQKQEQDDLPVVPLEHFSVGDVVWARSKGCPFWPAQVLDERLAPDAVRKMKKVKTLCVVYLGPPTNEKRGVDYGWIKSGEIQPFSDYLERFRSQNITKSHKASNFVGAIEVALGVLSGELEGQGTDLLLEPGTGLAGASAGGGPRCVSCGLQVKKGSFHQARGWTNLCRNCKSCYENGDFCKVCERLYSPTEKDMVCCDTCNSWIHGACDPEASRVIATVAKDPKADVPYRCGICREVFQKPRKPQARGRGIKGFLGEGTRQENEARRLFALDFLTDQRKRKSTSIRSVKEEEAAVRRAWEEAGAEGQAGYMTRAQDAQGASKHAKKDRQKSGKEGRVPTRGKNAPGPWNAANKKDFVPVPARWAKDHCSVCNLDYDYDYNQFVTCADCGVTVHQYCYGVLQIPEADVPWLCRACENRKPNERRPQCCVCPVEGGALKPTTLKNHWCHVACCQWIPELTVVDQEHVEPVDRIHLVHKERWSHRCSICKRDEGAIIQCHECYVAFHPLCARMSGFEMRTIETDDGMVECRAYCARHSRDVKPGRGLLPAATEVALVQAKPTLAEGGGVAEVQKVVLTDPSQYVMHVELPELRAECQSGCARCEPLCAEQGWEREPKGSGRGFSSARGWWIPRPPDPGEDLVWCDRRSKFVKASKISERKPKAKKSKKSHGSGRKKPDGKFDYGWTKEPVPMLPLPKGCPEWVGVRCGDLHGSLEIRTQKVTFRGQEVTASTFESLGGKASAKKWKTSLWLCDESGRAVMQMLDYLDSHRLTKEYMLRLKNNAERRSQYEEWMDHVTLTECRAAVERCVHRAVVAVAGSDSAAALKDLVPSQAETTLEAEEEGRPETPVPSQAETTLEAEEEGRPETPPPASPPTPRESSEEAEDCAAGVVSSILEAVEAAAAAEAALASSGPWPQLGPSLVGLDLSLWHQPEGYEGRWREAKVVDHQRDCSAGQWDAHRVEYLATGEREWVFLRDEKLEWRLARPSTPAPADSVADAEPANERGTPRDYSGCVGCRIGVWWKDDERFYYGEIGAHDPRAGRQDVWYDDGQKEWLDLNAERVDFKGRGEQVAAQRTQGSSLLVEVECNGLVGHLSMSTLHHPRRISFLGAYLDPSDFVALCGRGFAPDEWRHHVLVAGTGKELGEWLEEQERAVPGHRRRHQYGQFAAPEGRQARRTRERRRERAGKQAFVTGLAYRVGLPSEAVRGLESVAHTGEEWLCSLKSRGISVKGQRTKEEEEDNARRQEVSEVVREILDRVEEAAAKEPEPEPADAVAREAEEEVEPEEVVVQDEAWMVSQIVDHIEFLPKLGLFPERGIVGTRVELAPASREGPKLQWVVEGFDLEEGVLLVRPAPPEAPKPEAPKPKRMAEMKAERERLKAEADAEKARLKAEKDAEKARLKAEKDAEKAKLKAEKDAEKAKLKAEKDAEKARLKAEKDAKKAKLKAEKDAKKAKIKAKASASDKPKMPPNAYILFGSVEREVISKVNPGMGSKEIMSEIARRWKQIDPERKGAFEAEAAKLLAKWKLDNEKKPPTLWPPSHCPTCDGGMAEPQPPSQEPQAAPQPDQQQQEPRQVEDQRPGQQQPDQPPPEDLQQQEPRQVEDQRPGQQQPDQPPPGDQQPSPVQGPGKEQRDASPAAPPLPPLPPEPLPPPERIPFGDESLQWHTLFGPKWKKSAPPQEFLFSREADLWVPRALGVHCVGWRVQVSWEDGTYYYGVVDDYNFLSETFRIYYDDGSYEWFGSDQMLGNSIRWLAAEGDYKKPNDSVPSQILIVSNGVRATFHVHTRQVEVDPKALPKFVPKALPKVAAEGRRKRDSGPDAGRYAAIDDAPDGVVELECSNFVQDAVDLVSHNFADLLMTLAPGKVPTAAEASEIARAHLRVLEAREAEEAKAEEAKAEEGVGLEASGVATELVTLDEFESRARIHHPDRKKKKARVFLEDKYTVMQWLLREGLEMSKQSLGWKKRGLGEGDEKKKKRRKKVSEDKAEEEERPQTFDLVPLLDQVSACAQTEKRRVTFGKSVIHGWGLFAKEAISEGEAVVEYRGDVVRGTVANQREARYREACKDLYLFTANADQVIDGTDCGSIGRFMNHSCAPSCYIKHVQDEENCVPHLAFFARCDIMPGQELTFDYRLKEEDQENKIECKCGAPTCKGTLN